MSNQPKSHEHRSGFVSFVGRPNAGKSTLLNALIGQKLAIVADKPQTTRTTIQGVLTIPGAQVVFLDTPGVHKSDTPLNKRMMESVRSALQERDLLLFVIDATKPFTEEDSQVIDLIRKCETPTFALFNKIDRLENRQLLLPLLETYQKAFDFTEYFPISASTGENLGPLREAIIKRLPEGPAFFPKDYLTDQPERFLAAEIVREKILDLTHAEVPHSVAVLVETWEEKPKITRISAVIYVERPGQKGIIIGQGGALLKKAGTLARQDLERLLRKKVFLELFVKVREKWRENPQFLNEIDWRSMVGSEE